MALTLVANTGLIAALLLAAPSAILGNRVAPVASDVAAKVSFLGFGSRAASFPAVSGAVKLVPR